MREMLRDLRGLLAGCGADWAVCGGFAIELFLGRETRPHGDLDLAVPEEDRREVERFMREQGWLVYEFRGQGKLRRLTDGALSEPGRNLMCLREGCDLVTFWPCDEPGLVLHEWHASGIRTLNYMEFLFHRREGGAMLLGDARREVDRAILRRDGVPCLAPEVVLLLKAAQPEREANQQDFAAAFPALTEERRGWLLDSLRRQYPGGHPWLTGEAVSRA
ncbi:MAG: hypothetical protein J1E43_11695 [Christensenellaceae bacterium]|nr:hypothetical protein [Christensenellaceae bacterium]